MDLVLCRKSFEASGVYGVLTSQNIALAVTLEHAYPNQSSFSPKLPNGQYECVRGMHLLEGMTSPFETFEITGVPGHQGVLFHVGNTNADSSGCVLLGQARYGLSIIESRKTFDRFMMMLMGIDRFSLVVK